MIESKTLGSAAGVQKQDVIDNSEGINLPSLNNGVIMGRFKRGRMDKPFTVTPASYKALLGHDPANKSYLAVEDAFKRGVMGVSVLRVGETGDVTAPPVPSSIPLKFTTTRNTGSDELPIGINITNAEGEWELRESGVKVADSSGFLSAGITYSFNDTNPDYTYTTLTLASAGVKKTYEFFGRAYILKIYRTVNPIAVDGSVVVLGFSDEVTKHALNLPNTNLVVPNALPDYITSLSHMFQDSNLFNQDISGWDVSNVTSMVSTFANCDLFNQDISGWNVSNVTSMTSMVFDCISLKSDLSMWCVTNITIIPVAFLGNNKPTAPFKSPVWGTCPRGENMAA